MSCISQFCSNFSGASRQNGGHFKADRPSHCYGCAKFPLGHTNVPTVNKKSGCTHIRHRMVFSENSSGGHGTKKRGRSRGQVWLIYVLKSFAMIIHRMLDQITIFSRFNLPVFVRLVADLTGTGKVRIKIPCSDFPQTCMVTRVFLF